MPENITKILQIKDIILCCDEYLFLYNIKSLKDNPVKYPLKLNDILKLNDGKLLGITNKNLIIIDIESIIAELATNKIKNHHKIVFKFPDDWYIKPTLKKTMEKIYMHLLSNNKLLLHFFLIEKEGTCKITRYKWNKIYILDLNNYRLIHSFEKIRYEIKIIVLSNYICIKDSKTINIYNINDYKLVNDLELEFYNSSIDKYKDNILIELFTYDGDIVIILYDLSNVKKMKKCILRIKHIKCHVFRMHILNNLKIFATGYDIPNYYAYILKVDNLNFN